MGQAKLRGTFEQRQTEAHLRNAIEQEERIIKEAAREAAMTPEQKASQRQAQANLVALLSMSIGSLMK